ncbi:MAG: hypothetical protein U0414_37060 [Polyangiaceae bacterium]
MNREGTHAIFAAAVSGLFVGCAESSKPTAASASASARSGSAAMMHGESADKNCCAGKNACKGKGGCGGDGHDCAGKNECKGKGGCSMRDCTASAASSAKP